VPVVSSDDTSARVLNAALNLAPASMHLVQLLLPLYDNAGTPFPAAVYAELRSELTERFGGLTAYSRAPAEGVWNDGGQRRRDDIVVYEVMVQEVDRTWWRALRERLERNFAQEELVIRAQPAERL
jgi:hypothetical protein